MSYQLLRTKSKRRRVRISQGNAGVLQMDLDWRANHCGQCSIVNWSLNFQLAPTVPVYTITLLNLAALTQYSPTAQSTTNGTRFTILQSRYVIVLHYMDKAD